MTLETIAASEIEVLTTLRQRVQELSGKISEDKFFQIPTGFNNSIAWNVGPCSRTGVMSLKTMPGFGKSGTSLISAWICAPMSSLITGFIPQLGAAWITGGGTFWG